MKKKRKFLKHQGKIYDIITGKFWRPSIDGTLIVIGDRRGKMFDFNLDKRCIQKYK